MVALNPQVFSLSSNIGLLLSRAYLYVPGQPTKSSYLLYCQTHSFCFPVFTTMFLMGLDNGDTGDGPVQKTCMFLKGLILIIHKVTSL